MDKSPLRAFVTGAGSGVGQGIIKALRASSLPLHVIAADIGIANQALFRADEAYIIPRVEEPGALEAMEAILHKAAADILFVGSEFETLFFSRHRDYLETQCRTHICVASEDAITLANDKWLTACRLRDAGLPYPRSILGQKGEAPLDRAAAELGYPCVLKTRTGTSNRHVHIVRSSEELAALWDTVPNPVVQELLAEPSSRLDAEYTCSVFRCADGTLLGPFTARRTLRGGNSWVVEVDAFPELHAILLAIGKALDFSGSLNIQLMLTPRGPVPFELNMRFSGTTAVRAHFGFNEPEMYIRSYLLGETLERPHLRRGLALRYLEEVFVEGVTLDEIDPEHLPRGETIHWF